MWRVYFQRSIKIVSTVLGVNKRNVAAQCLVFYAAGFETSSFTISSCLHVAAYHPEIQRKVQTEIDNVLARHDHRITYESLQEMTYLDTVIAGTFIRILLFISKNPCKVRSIFHSIFWFKETLRLFPPVPELMRKCTKTYTTSQGYVVDEGVRVVIPVHAIHRDPQHYPDPESFIPERFDSETQSQRHKYAYLPFGRGPRSCIGKFRTVSTIHERGPSRSSPRI